ncbi:DMT family transporter, partial [Nocardia salmonicida]|uniref:DMT family transporter n=1 Tax=Nocardia salmonicida TaxID=53431 RepID=UPI0033C0903E
LVGGVLILAAGSLGVVSLDVASADVTLADATMPWWVPVAGLAVVTAALAYTTGIAAVRRLGSRLASFVALTEVLAAVLFAWLLLGELPRSIQFLGGLAILAGVVLVKLDEDRSAEI